MSKDYLVHGTKEYWIAENNHNLDVIEDLKFSIELMKCFCKSKSNKITVVNDSREDKRVTTFHKSFKDAVESKGLNYDTYRRYPRPFKKGKIYFQEFLKEDWI